METTRMSFHVERKEISYLRWIFESYDGVAFLKTLDPSYAFIELEISPGCEAIVLALLESLRIDERIKIDPVKS